MTSLMTTFIIGIVCFIVGFLYCKFFKQIQGFVEKVYKIEAKNLN